jgi:hypothetical protein
MRVLGVTFAFLTLSMAVTAQAPAPKPESTLLQVMRAILFPNSNIIFDAQNEDPGAPKNEGAEGKYGNVYGGWMAVENAALALSEAANLLMIPGRMCGNGKPAPLNRPDWPKFVAELREAGQVAYKAALTKNQDNIVDASGTVTEACSACHDVYREKTNLADRCTP